MSFMLTHSPQADGRLYAPTSRGPPFGRAVGDNRLVTGGYVAKP